MCDLAIFFPSTLAELGDISRETPPQLQYTISLYELRTRTSIYYTFLAKNTIVM